MIHKNHCKNYDIQQYIARNMLCYCLKETYVVFYRIIVRIHEKFKLKTSFMYIRY
jgi:hypothetical protein